ncbi:MAG TPA: Rieske 2Fe-2S domain-containing protein [Candidatus Acidoferrales bacterium]|nr:Rieske 2Fe-2S domain-containing protein [Candidatus Acidoferrales bacterium]
MSENGSQERAAAEALRGCWYPALRSAELRGRGPATAELLGEALVVGRDAQKRPFALRDFCPHRGMPLSAGHFDGETVECSYHGWRFDCRSGQCREIPSLVPGEGKLKPERIFAAAFPAEEADGYVWVYFADPDHPEAAMPPAPRLWRGAGHSTTSHLWCDLACDVDQGVIGLMDPAHGPFVHQSWWWRKRGSIQVKTKIFEPIPNGFRMRQHEPSANSAPYKLLKFVGRPLTTIEFVLPNMRFERVEAGKYWFSSRTTVTPVTANRSRIDVVAAWNILPWMPGLPWFARQFGAVFLRQDQETMEKQAVGLARSHRQMLIDDADRQARWYFQLKEAYIEAQRTGQPMKHPIPEAVTLRWRS